ncbi:MFS transporter, partial [Patulibacter sp. NPDC049589]|uniref:MFS transporter n=1 Tax=Patulibacter sp. NPDC049589 TaxID=3154731 RepID=UPI00342B8D5F
FVGASVLCALAPSQEVLVLARFVQGAGGAMASAVVLGMIVTMFPEPREQAKALGAYMFVAVAGGTIGLLVGGVITEAISWHWVFVLNVPIGVATVVLTLRLVTADEGLGLKAGADVLGGALVTAALMLGVYALVGAESDGWVSFRTLGLGSIALLLLIAFVLRESSAREPLIPLRIFRSRNVSGANTVIVLTMAGMFAIGFLAALYLQRVLGYSPVEVGFAFLPATVVMGALSLRYTAGLTGRFGARPVLLAGLLIVAASLAWFARVPVDGDYAVDLLPAMLLQGIGAGLAFPALMTVAMSGVPPQDAGLASGLVNTTQQMGGALGLAVLATLSATRSEELRAAGDSAAEALTGGYHLAFGIAAALVLVAVVLAAVVLQPAPATDGEHEGAAAGEHEPAGEPAVGGIA